MKHPYMGSEPLGLPLCMRSVDYSLLPVGAMAGRTLPGGRTYTQAVGANQTEETVQTSASTVARWAFVANLPRIGLLADGGIGLVLEPPRTNLIPWSRDLASGTWQAESLTTVTSNVGAGPDGASLADREQVSSTGFGRYRFDLVLTTSTAYYGSVWQRANSGTSSWQIDVNASGATNVNQWYGGASVSTTWERRGVGNTTGAAGIVGGLLSADGRDGSAAGGIAAGARDLWVDLHQFEPGKYPTNAIITAGTTASRAGFRVSIPISHYVIGGSFRAQISHVPWADCTAYDGDSATVRLWTIDANTYAEINTTTRVLTVCVNGVSRVAAVPVWWLSGHRIEWYWRVGNGTLFVRYRLSTDKGVSYTLPFDPFAGVQYTDAAISTSTTSLDLWSDGGSSKWFGTGACKEDFLYTAPAWALQALPTDVASVKAFFRADSSYTLAGSLVSAWAGQTATAVTPFTQGVTASQPAINATGFGTARPSFTYDGANDYMEAGPLSEWLTRGAVYVLFKCAVVSTNNSPNYNNRPLWQNVGAAVGVGLRNGPIAGAFNHDGTYDDASVAFALSTSQVLRWRHNLTNLYVRVTGGSESAATPSGATSILTGNNRIGGNPGAVGVYYQGEIAAVVAMNTDPTDPEDTAIMDFLNRYGGLA